MPGLNPIRTSLFALSITTLFFSLPRTTPAATVNPQFPFTVPVEQGATYFQGGDQILITEVHGTASQLMPGNKYQIKGEYRLVSHPEASLTAGVIAPNGSAPILSNQQSMSVQKGTGEFTLVLPYATEGQPRITFTSDDVTGQNFGNLSLISTQFPYVIAFDPIVSCMQLGDDVSITDIRSSSAGITPGSTLQITGTCGLFSSGTAQLTSLTGNAPVAGNANQSLQINQGSGDFTIVVPAVDSQSNSTGNSIGLALWPVGSANTPSSTIAYKLGKSLRASPKRPSLRPLQIDPDSKGLLFNYSLRLDNGRGYVDGNSFITTQFPYVVPFKLGLTHFAGGDEINIRQVRGTSKVIQIGGSYKITGTYTLSSSSEALLATYVTIGGNIKPSPIPAIPQQSMQINRGSGSFSLILPVRDRGWPHLAFYPTIAGQAWVSDSGTRYFGTGDTVLKNWNQPVPPD
jgi:hypothetical protein